jgi:hypothetical protein
MQCDDLAEVEPKIAGVIANGTGEASGRASRRRAANGGRRPRADAQLDNGMFQGQEIL